MQIYGYHIYNHCTRLCRFWFEVRLCMRARTRPTCKRPSRANLMAKVSRLGSKENG